MYNNKWFNNINTIEELKKEYGKLALKYHPDINADINADQNMKEINAEYDLLFSYIIEHSTEDQRKQYNKQGHNINDNFKEIINKIIFIPNIIIEICGSWIWISGQTKPIKDQLKQAGFRWAMKKVQWYWCPEEYKQPFYKKSMSMEHIRSKYGSKKIQNKPFEQIDQTA